MTTISPQNAIPQPLFVPRREKHSDAETKSNSIRILFVDDEQVLLNGIERMLSAKSEDWLMDFVTSGEEALKMLEETNYDVIVSDMRMPRMDGAELLSEVKRRHPEIIRIILSGFSEKDMILRSVGMAHQYLSKPFSAEGIEETIARALSLKQVLTDQSLQTLVSKIEKLPSLPELYKSLMDELGKEDPDHQVIADVINHDIGMTAKILQIINSAFFGLRRSVTDVNDAVRMLGTDTIKALALSVGVFSQVKVSGELKADLNAIWNHSMEVGLTAKAISNHEGSVMTDEAFTVGFLHDVGTLVMMLNMPHLYRDVKHLTEIEGFSRLDAERMTYGTTHCAIGAYLLGLWGLPWNMTEAVAFYAEPGSHSYRSFRPLTALHVAHVLVESPMESIVEITPRFDLEYLERIGAKSSIPDWHDLFHRLSGEDAEQEEEEE